MQFTCNRNSLHNVQPLRIMPEFSVSISVRRATIDTHATARRPTRNESRRIADITPEPLGGDGVSVQHMSKHPNRRPWLGSPVAKRRNARLGALIKAGKIKPLSKAELQQIANTVRCKGQRIP